MSKKSFKHTRIDLERLLQSTGDMALKRRAKQMVEDLELKSRDKVLEIGCGDGYYLSLLRRFDPTLNLVGVDIDKSALVHAKEYISARKVKLILANAEKLPFKDESFDKIVMSEVIEHVVNEHTVLSEARRVLKTGGVMVLTTCNIDYPFFWDPVNWVLQHLFYTHIQKGFWAGIWNQHLRMYNKKELEKLLKEVGFSISQSKILTSWCLPFNHYIVNFMAILFAKRKLPRTIFRGIDKFHNYEQPALVRLAFSLVSLFDRLNDLFPQDFGVSIFIKAKKIK